MIIYRVIDDGEAVLTTDSRLKALEKFYEVMQKHEQLKTWGWIGEEQVK